MKENILEIFLKSPVIFVDNIFDYVYNDDKEYALRVKEQLKSISGLCYVNKKNKIETLVVKEKGVTTIGSIIHEKIHEIDYLMLSEIKKEENLRLLQEDFAFHYWTEFHATYICYKILIDNYGYEKNAVFFAKSIFEEARKEFGKKTLILSKAADFSVRLFGKYMAALDRDKDILEIFPVKLFLNYDFGIVYYYLYNHRTFDSIKDNIDEFRDLLKRLENYSKKNNFDS